MNVRDWESWTGGAGQAELRLAQVSQDISDAVGAFTNVVRIDREYALKMLSKHRLLPVHLPALDETLDRGEVLLDGKQYLVFAYFEPYVWNRWFLAVVKRCYEHRRLYVVTFHKSKIAQVRRKRQRLKLLRAAKD